MTLRRALFVSHRYCGLLLALFLLVAGVTGCLLVFRGGLDAALNPDLFRAPSRQALPPLEIARRVALAHPDWTVRSVDLRTTAGEALLLTVDDPAQTTAEQLFVDPADGRVLGLRSSEPGLDRRHLFEAIHLLHYTLLAGTIGRWFLGLVAFGWLLLNILGLCITWPRRVPLLANWRPAFRSSRRALRERPLPELHRVSGLWLVPFLSVLAYTSVAMNFYDELFQPLLERLSPPRSGSPFDRPSEPAMPGPPIGLVAAERLAIAASASRTPHLSPVSIADDSGHGLYEVAFAPGGTRLYEGYGRVTYCIDRRDGHLVWIDQPRLDGWGRLVLRSLYPLHSGQVAGLPTRLLVLALGLATCGLGITGVLPWWRRAAAQRWALRRRLPAVASRCGRSGQGPVQSLNDPHEEVVPCDRR